MIQVDFHYDAGRYSNDSIERMAGHFLQLLEGIAADPEARIGELPLLTEGERRRMLVEWNDTATDYPRHRCVHQLFEEQVERTPNAVAVVFGDEVLTYGQLNERANRLAHHLIEKGVGPDVLVGLCVERSLEMVIGLLGILKAGGAYLPLDTDDPRERLEFMLREGDVEHILTQEACCGQLPTDDRQVVYLDADAAWVENCEVTNPAPDVDTERLAYVMFTSGSTGRPKGVCVPHRGVVRLVRGTNYFPFSAERVFLQFAPASFDAATFEIWGALLNGARLVVAPPGKHDPGVLGALISRYGVDTLWLTSSLLNLIVDQERLDALKGLTHLLVGGEALSPSHIREALAQLEGVRLVNGYGPTENTTFTCFFPIEDVSERNSIPIGRPIANTQVYLLDGQCELVRDGLPGELYIAGDGLARGYLNDPELTAERFVVLPGRRLGLDGDDPVRLYRSGDLCRWTNDGNLEFLGRLDDQVKLRGFRIEPGEVEVTLNTHPQVAQSAVVVREDNPGERQLVAYCTLVPGAEWNRFELRTHLRGRLPDYMVPAVFVRLQAFPMTANGKLDRGALPPPAEEDRRISVEHVSPRTPLEKELVAIWREVLDLEHVGIYDNFFDLGGHSLLATQVVARIGSVVEEEVPLLWLFEAPTVAELAVRVLDQHLHAEE